MSSVGFPLIGNLVPASGSGGLTLEDELSEEDSEQVAVDSTVTQSVGEDEEAEIKAMDDYEDMNEEPPPVQVIFTEEHSNKVCIESLPTSSRSTTGRSDQHNDGHCTAMLHDDVYTAEKVHSGVIGSSSRINGFQPSYHRKDDGHASYDSSDILAVVDFDGEVALPTDPSDGEEVASEPFDEENNTGIKIEENFSLSDQRPNIFSTDLYRSPPIVPDNFQFKREVDEIVENLAEDGVHLPEFVEPFSDNLNQHNYQDEPIIKQEPIDDGDFERNIFASVSDNTTSHTDCIPPLPRLQRSPFVSLDLLPTDSPAQSTTSDNEHMKDMDRNIVIRKRLNKLRKKYIPKTPKIKVESTDPPDIDFMGDSSIRNIFEVFDHDVKPPDVDQLEIKQSPTKDEISTNVAKKKSVVFSTLKELQYKYPGLYKEKTNTTRSTHEDESSNQGSPSELSMFMNNVSVKLEPLDLPTGITMIDESYNYVSGLGLLGTTPEVNMTDVSNDFGNVESLDTTSGNPNADSSYNNFGGLAASQSNDIMDTPSQTVPSYETSSCCGTGSLFTRNNNEDFVPDFDEIDDLMFISFSTQDSLEAHVEIERQTQQPRNKHKDLLGDISHFKTKSSQSSQKQKKKKAKRGSGVNHGFRGIKNKILLYERMLCDELSKKKHRQTIHPDLKKAGIKLNKSPAKRYNLDKLGVNLDLPNSSSMSFGVGQETISSKASNSKTKATSRKKSSKSGKSKKRVSSSASQQSLIKASCSLSAPPAETLSKKSESATVSHVSLTADPEKLRLPESESKPFKPFELPVTSKTSAFVSEELDEYLDKLQDISSVLTESKITATPVSYFQPNKPQSYVRTLDMVLNRRKKNKLQNSEPSSKCDSLIYPSTADCTETFRNKPQEKLDSKKKPKRTRKKKKVAPKKVTQEDSDDSVDRMQRELLQQVTCTSPTLSDSGSDNFESMVSSYQHVSDDYSDYEFDGGFDKPRMDSEVIPFCGKDYCKLGCLCGSVEGSRPVSLVASHCRKVDCMFGCTCDSSLKPSQKKPIFKFEGEARHQGKYMEMEPTKKPITSNLTRFETCSRTRTYISRLRKKHCSCLNRGYHMHDHVKEKNKLKEKETVPLVVYQVNGSNQLVAVPAQVRKEPKTASEKLAQAKQLSKATSPLVVSQDKVHGFMLAPVLTVQNPPESTEPSPPKNKKKRKRAKPKKEVLKPVSTGDSNNVKQFHFTGSLLGSMQKVNSNQDARYRAPTLVAPPMNVAPTLIAASTNVAPTTLIAASTSVTPSVMAASTSVTPTTGGQPAIIVASTSVAPPLKAPSKSVAQTLSVASSVSLAPTFSGPSTSVALTLSRPSTSVPLTFSRPPTSLINSSPSFIIVPPMVTASPNTQTAVATVSASNKPSNNPNPQSVRQVFLTFPSSKDIQKGIHLSDHQFPKQTLAVNSNALIGTSRMTFIDAIASSINNVHTKNLGPKILVPINLVPKDLIPKDPLCIQIKNPTNIESGKATAATTANLNTITQASTSQLPIAQNTIVIKEMPPVVCTAEKKDTEAIDKRTSIDSEKSVVPESVVPKSVVPATESSIIPEPKPTVIDLTDDTENSIPNKTTAKGNGGSGALATHLPTEAVKAKTKLDCNTPSSDVVELPSTSRLPPTKLDKSSNKAANKALMCIDKVVRGRSRYNNRPWETTSLMVVNKTSKDQAHPVLIDINSNENWHEEKSVIVTAILQSTQHETISTKASGFTLFLFYSDKTRTVHLKPGNAMSGKHNVKTITVWVFVPRVPIKLTKKPSQKITLDKTKMLKGLFQRNKDDDDDDCKIIGVIDSNIENNTNVPRIVNCTTPVEEIRDLVNDSEAQDTVIKSSVSGAINKGSNKSVDTRKATLEKNKHSIVNQEDTESDCCEFPKRFSQRKRRRLNSQTVATDMSKVSDSVGSEDQGHEDVHGNYSNHSNIFDKMGVTNSACISHKSGEHHGKDKPLSGEAEMDGKEEPLSTGKAETDHQDQHLSADEAEIDHQKDPQSADEAEMDQKEERLSADEAEMENQEDPLSDGEAEMDNQEEPLYDGEAEMDRRTEPLSDGEAEINNQEEPLFASEAEMDGNKETVSAAESEMDDKDESLPDESKFDGNDDPEHDMSDEDGKLNSCSGSEVQMDDDTDGIDTHKMDVFEPAVVSTKTDGQFDYKLSDEVDIQSTEASQPVQSGICCNNDSQPAAEEDDDIEDGRLTIDLEMPCREDPGTADKPVMGSVDDPYSADELDCVVEPSETAKSDMDCNDDQHKLEKTNWKRDHVVDTKYSETVDDLKIDRQNITDDEIENDGILYTKTTDVLDSKEFIAETFSKDTTASGSTGSPEQAEDLLAQSIRETYEQWHKIINGEIDKNSGNMMSTEGELSNVPEVIALPSEVDTTDNNIVKGDVEPHGLTTELVEIKKCSVRSKSAHVSNENKAEVPKKNDDHDGNEPKSASQTTNESEIVSKDNATNLELPDDVNSDNEESTKTFTFDNCSGGESDAYVDEFVDIEGPMDTEDLKRQTPVVEPIEKLHTVIDIEGNSVPLGISNVEESSEKEQEQIQNVRRSGRTQVKSWKLISDSQNDLPKDDDIKVRRSGKKKKDKHSKISVDDDSTKKVASKPKTPELKMVYGEVPYIYTPPALTSKRKRKDLGVDRGTLDQQLQKLVAEEQSVNASPSKRSLSNSSRNKKSKNRKKPSIVDVWRLTDEELGVDVAPFNDDTIDEELIDVEGSYEIPKNEVESDYNIVEELKKQRAKDAASWKPPAKNIICDLASKTLHPPSSSPAAKKRKQGIVKGTFHDMSQFLGEPQFTESVVACMDNEEMQPGRLVHNIKERQRRQHQASCFRYLKEVVCAHPKAVATQASSKQTILHAAIDEIEKVRDEAALLMRQKFILTKKNSRLKNKLRSFIGMSAAVEENIGDDAEFDFEDVLTSQSVSEAQELNSDITSDDSSD